MSFSPLERLMLSSGPFQESLIRNLTPKDFLKMRLAGVRISTCLTRNLQSKYLFSHCDVFERSVNTFKNCHGSANVRYCSSKTPQTHTYPDYYGCSFCINIDLLHRAPWEMRYLGYIQNSFCDKCVRSLIKQYPLGITNCTCLEKWHKDGWQCEECWTPKLDPIINENRYLGKRDYSCATPCCGIPPRSSRPDRARFRWKHDDMAASATLCTACNGLKVWSFPLEPSIFGFPRHWFLLGRFQVYITFRSSFCPNSKWFELVFIFSAFDFSV